MPIIYDQTYTFEIVIIGDVILGDLESEIPDSHSKLVDITHYLHYQ